jgi:antitoxin Xre/MbcA/ParS-like protein
MLMPVPRPRQRATTASPVQPGTTVALSGPALRTFFRIADAWGLSADEARRLLGDPPRSTYFLWKKSGEQQLSRDTLERISYVLGIWKALQILIPDESAADAWVRKPNAAPPFGGKPALERMLSGNVADLYVVRQFLDAQRGGWS